MTTSVACCFAVPLLLAVPAGAQTVATEAPAWREYSVEALPADAATDWRLPFATTDRRDLRAVRVLSAAGAGRTSFRRGHLHTGIDIVPARGREPVVVLAMGAGVVASVHLADPHRTVVVRHRLADGSALFTSYKHLHTVDVAPGDAVATDTRLGRLHSRAEAAAFGGPFDHLHLEVRRAFDDYGTASWLTMSARELRARFLDPCAFLARRVGGPGARPPCRPAARLD